MDHPQNIPPRTEAAPPDAEAQRLKWITYAFLIAAGALRFWSLDGKSLWVDEAKGLNDCAAPLKGVLYLCQTGHTAPLREFILHFLIQAPRPLWEPASRFPSALAGMLLVPLIFRLGARLFGKGPGICAALFLLLNPWHILHSQDSRMHAVTLLLAAAALSVLCALLYEKSTRRGWALWGAVVALGAYFSYLSALPLVAMICMILWEAQRCLRRRDLRCEGKQILVGSMIAAAVFLALYAPWLRYGLLAARLYTPQTAAVVSDSASPRPGRDVFASEKPNDSASEAKPAWSPFQTHYDRGYLARFVTELGGMNPISGGIAFALALLGLLAMRRNRRLLPIPLFWFLAPLPVFLATSAGQYFPTRYLTYYLVVYSLLVGLGGYTLLQWLRGRLARIRPLRPRAALTLAAALALGPLLAAEIWQAGVYFRSEKQNWRDAVHFIEQRTHKGQLLIIGDHWAYFGVIPYLQKQLSLAPNTLSLDLFREALDSRPDVWYIYWAPLPPSIRQIVDKEMEPMATYPGMLGDVHVLRKKPVNPN